MTLKIGQLITWFVIWIALTGSLNLINVLLGIMASLAVYAITYEIYNPPYTPVEIWRPRLTKNYPFLRALWLLYYISAFLWQWVKSACDIGWRVLRPNIDATYATIKIKTSLSSDTALALLANTLTLTPGMTTIDVDRNERVLYVHIISAGQSGRKEAAGLVMAGRFENMLKVIFE